MFLVQSITVIGKQPPISLHIAAAKTGFSRGSISPPHHVHQVTKSWLLIGPHVVCPPIIIDIILISINIIITILVNGGAKSEHTATTARKLFYTHKSLLSSRDGPAVSGRF